MRLVSVVGTRPQLIKAAALEPVLRSRHEAVFVDTGQHWDESMAGSFFRELDLPRPDHSLGAGGGSHAEQLAAMLVGLEPILIDARPDAVLVYGDTNSMLAGTLVAAKLNLPVAHVEAGLRSFDRRMPEELNRLVADRLAHWLFAPTSTAVANLAAEGLSRGVTLVGDLMQDLAARTLETIRSEAVVRDVFDRLARETRRPRLAELGSGGYLFATVHRQENRDRDALAAWAGLLDRLASGARPVVLALHPGTRRALAESGLGVGPNVEIIEPQGYRTALALQLHAAAVVTDSGGVQREAAWLGTPCLVIRDTTEWPETITGPDALSVLVGRNADVAAAELERLAPPSDGGAAARTRAADRRLAPAGAAAAIVRALESG